MIKGPMSFLAILIIPALAVLPAASRQGQSPSNQGGPGYLENSSRLRILSSSHQDIAWMNSPQACMEYRDLQCITPALQMMADNKDYCFVMENMLNLMEYLERHPERKADIERFTREGRLEWGATFNQPYESLYTGEQLVRETYFGRRWLKKNLPGCDARVYFNPDVPGRSLQMQQILSKAGIPYILISRYHEGLYRWLSPDGSSVLAYSPGHYSNAAAILNAPPAEAVKLLTEKLTRWSPYYQGRGIPAEFPLLNSVDFSKPTDFRELIQAWNESHRAADGRVASTMNYSSTRDFFDSLAGKDAKFDRVMGERPNLWLYIHGPTHHWAISAQREAGVILPAAEVFSTAKALLEGSFKDYPAKTLSDAWMASIYPDHGWGGKEGQITDRLFRKKYEFARDEGKAVLTGALQAIAGRVKTSASRGTPVVVFNALSWQRTDTVECRVPFGGRTLEVFDGRGTKVAGQVLPPVHGRAPGMTRLQFLASDVPPLGYKTFYLVESQAVPETKPIEPSTSTYENGFYKLELVPGGVKSIFDKELGRDILNTSKFLGFEVFTMQSVGNGAGEFGRVQQPTMEGFDKLSTHRPAWRFEAGESGPLQAVFSLIQPLADCTIKEKLIISSALKKIDCEVEILGWDGSPYREWRLAVPSTGGQAAYEVPMGVVEVGKDEIPGTGGPAYGNLNYDELCSQIRPREVQDFMNVSDGRAGMTLSTSVAVMDFQDPTADPVSYPVLQAILLASRRSCHGEGNWYLQEGDHHFRFSLTSHAAGWKNGYRRGIQANNPLLSVVGPLQGAAADLPEERSFASVSAGNVIISTIKKCEDDDSVIIRCYDIEGKDSPVELKLFVPAGSAERVNIIEEEGRPLKPVKNALAVTIGHHAIETFKISPRLGPRKQGIEKRTSR